MFQRLLQTNYFVLPLCVQRDPTKGFFAVLGRLSTTSILSIITNNWRETAQWPSPIPNILDAKVSYFLKALILYSVCSKDGRTLTNKYCHGNPLLWGKKSGWKFRGRRFGFQQNCCRTDGPRAFVSPPTHTPHQSTMLPFGTRLFLLSAFFVVVFNVVPHYKAPIQLLGMLLQWQGNLRLFYH